MPPVQFGKKLCKVGLCRGKCNFCFGSYTRTKILLAFSMLPVGEGGGGRAGTWAVGVNNTEGKTSLFLLLLLLPLLPDDADDD